MEVSFEERMRALATTTTGPDGEKLYLLPLPGVEELHQETKLSRREIQIRALEAHILPERYLRSFGTIGWQGQLALLRAKVAVIGAGGLGGYICEGLARLGVGRVVVVDGDVFAEHNLNRQLFSSEPTLGKGKAEVAKRRLAEVNSATEVQIYACDATADNLPEILVGADVVVDALDRLPSRLVLQDVAQCLGIPLVHGAIAGMMGQVMTILPGDAGLRAFYGGGRLPERGAETILGNPTGTPMMIAAWQVQEVMKLVTGLGELIRNRMLFLDAEAGRAEILSFGP